MKYISYNILLAMLILVILITGCSKFKAGVAIPIDIKNTELANVNSDTNNYKDQKILLVGNFSGLCGTGCCKDFIIKQGIESIKIDPNGIDVPNFNIGIPLKIYGIVKSTKTSPFILALGIEEIQ